MTEIIESADFTQFGLADFLLDSLSRIKVSIPTPVQSAAIPFGMEGKDILASAQTGTGKTLAYLLPIITQLENKSQGAALILTPTRELAQQVKDSIQQLLGRVNINFALLIGGEPMFKQYVALKRHPRIVIGTPGRINDHLTRRTLKLHETNFLVLDETDRMLDLGFSQDLERIADHLPKERQTFMFSATMPPSIVKLSQQYLTSPQRITIGSSTQPSAKIKQETVQTTSSNKFSQLLKELEQREGSVIIFVKTKLSADRIADKLKDENHHAEAIHGDLKQRQRDQVIRNFRGQKYRILVATDVAARGLDIPHIMHVINFDLPQCPEDYIHRIGRTGRAGMEGNAVSFISPDEKWKWKSIHRLINDGQSDEAYSPNGNRRRGAGGSGGGRSFERRDDRRGGGYRRDDRGERSGGERSGGGDRSSHFRRDDSRSEGRPSFRRDDSRADAPRPSYRRDDDRSNDSRSEAPRSNYRRDDARGDDRRPSFRRDDSRVETRSDDRRPSFRRDDTRGGDDRRASPRRDDARTDDRRPSFRRDDSRAEPRSEERRPSFRRDDSRSEPRSEERRPSFRRDDSRGGERSERSGGDERRAAPGRSDDRKRTYKPKVAEGASTKRRYDAPKKEATVSKRKKADAAFSDIV